MPFAVLSRQAVIRKRLSTLLRLRRINRTVPSAMIALPMRSARRQVTSKVATATVVNDDVER